MRLTRMFVLLKLPIVLMCADMLARRCSHLEPRYSGALRGIAEGNGEGLRTAAAVNNI